MNKEGKIIDLRTVKGTFRALLLLFILCLSMGYLSGVYYVSITSGFGGESIEENYLGNEDNDDADVMKFKMHEKEVLSIIHSHTIIFSFVFLAMGFLLLQSTINTKLRKLLIIEPFLSILLTFGGIWLMWKGMSWMKYIVIISGSLMHLAFFSSALIVAKELLQNRKD